MRRRHWTATLLVGCALALPLPAQEPAPQAGEPGRQLEEREGVYVDTVEVNLINVDVYVTDKDGNRITGLTQDDFEIYEDGKPMAITNFYAVEGGQPASPGLPQASELPDLPTGERPEIAPIPEDQRLYLVIYVDNFNIKPFNRNRVLREVRQFLRDNLTREDRVMLVSYDRSLNLRRNFTSDPVSVAAALRELEVVTGHAVHHDSERRSTIDRIEDSDDPDEALSWVRSYAESVFNDLSFTVDALKEMVNSLAGVPGRKAVIYVSDGLPMIAGEDLFYYVHQKFSARSTSLTQAFNYDASRKFRELTAVANTNRVSFYTIDAAGLRVHSTVTAEYDGQPLQGAMVDTVLIQNMQSPLHFMAEQTGGASIVNSNRVIKHLERIAEDFRTYYSLGYTPAHSGDGRYHKIEVRLKDKHKGIRLRHREGYRDKTLSSRMSDGTMAALMYGIENNPIGLKLGFGEASRQDRGRYFVVPVAVAIPMGNLVMVPGPEFHVARVRLFIAALDAEGGTSQVQEVPVPLKIPNGEVEAARGQDFVYTVTLQMRGGRHKVAVGARDDLGAQTSFVTRGVDVGGS